jgi:hypothetical protein
MDTVNSNSINLEGPQIRERKSRENRINLTSNQYQQTHLYH